MLIIQLLLISFTLCYLSAVEALQCNACYDVDSLESCNAAAQLTDCTNAQVQRTHQALSDYNPSLLEAPEQDSFQCSTIEVQLQSNGSSHFFQGCGYENVDYCSSDWIAVNVERCSTCSTDVDCGVAEEGTNGENSEQNVLECTLCISDSSWDDCKEATVNCSDELIAATHGYLSEFHPALAQLPAEPRSFQCFALELELLVATNVVLMKSCTYKQSDFCDDWTNEDVTIRRCGLCSTGDVSAECNEWTGPKTSTTAAVSSTTTTAGETSSQQASTTATVVIHSTTTAASGGSTAGGSSTVKSSTAATSSTDVPKSELSTQALSSTGASTAVTGTIATPSTVTNAIFSSTTQQPNDASNNETKMVVVPLLLLATLVAFVGLACC